MSDVAIRVENLGKRYRIGALQQSGSGYRYKALRDVLAGAMSSAGRWAMAPFRGSPRAPVEDNEIWALKDLSFEIKTGEVVGIIGRNGAGKSTLLKVLSRITEPTEGYARIQGRVGSLLEVGTGFHPELTGRENIFLNGAVLGMKKAEIERKFDEIVAFAEVERFIDTPVKHFSSGMYLRLAFAVAAHLEPEILLVDEVLAVGDAQFQKKCLGKMGDVAKQGRTVLFVSHNMSAVRQLCTTALWIDNGKRRQYGSAEDIIAGYLRESYDSGMQTESVFEEDTAKAFQLRIGRLVSEDGSVTQNFNCDQRVMIELVCQVRSTVAGLYGYLSISKADGTTVMVSDSFDVGSNSLDELPIGTYMVRIPIPARTLGAGDYTVYINFSSRVSADKFNVDSPGIICTFHMDDFTSARGNGRLGFFSTLLPWTVSGLPESFLKDNAIRESEAERPRQRGIR